MAADTYTVQRSTAIAAAPERMEKFLGPDFEKGLGRLKATTEAAG
jgi:hypothetical protein